MQTLLLCDLSSKPQDFGKKPHVLGAEGSRAALPQLCAPAQALRLAGWGERRAAWNIREREGARGRLGFAQR